jgi:hypothetical protein
VDRLHCGDDEYTVGDELIFLREHESRPAN